MLPCQAIKNAENTNGNETQHHKLRRWSTWVLLVDRYLFALCVGVLWVNGLDGVPEPHRNLVGSPAMYEPAVCFLPTGLISSGTNLMQEPSNFEPWDCRRNNYSRKGSDWQEENAEPSTLSVVTYVLLHFLRDTLPSARRGSLDVLHPGYSGNVNLREVICEFITRNFDKDHRFASSLWYKVLRTHCLRCACVLHFQLVAVLISWTFILFYSQSKLFIISSIPKMSTAVAPMTGPKPANFDEVQTVRYSITLWRQIWVNIPRWVSGL